MSRITAKAADRVSAVCAAVLSALLVGYAISIAVVALTQGISGPEEVSSPTGVAVEVATFAFLGAGVGVVAVGRWRSTGWSTMPFVVAALLGLAVGVPLVTGVGGGVPAGAVTCAVSVVGLVALVVAALRRADEADPTAGAGRTLGAGGE